MKQIFFFNIVLAFFCIQQVKAQSCKTNAEVEMVPGEYQTAAQYPWPAVRAEYFKNLSTAADKAMAKQTLNQIEKIEAQSHEGFTLTGGNWENIYATKGYAYFGTTKLGQYSFEASLHEFFCLNGKLKRNDEAGTILRIYVNAIPTNTLSNFLDCPFGSSMGDYDFGLQYRDWKNHKPADVNAQLITLFSYLSCSNSSLMEAINTGEHYFQDVAEKNIRPNNRNTLITRYWFMKKKDTPVLVPVSRKEYLHSLLEYYDREQLYFPKLTAQLTADHDAGVKQYSQWQADVADKIAAVKKVLNEQDEAWLSKPAVINRLADASQTYKAGLKERTNYNRFWKFYDNEPKSEPLYKYNPACFTNAAQEPVKPRVITVVFRYVTIPASLRLLNNFMQQFDFDALRKLL